MAEKEIICKDMLESVLKTEFSTGMFSLSGYAEDAVCLRKSGSSWEVFVGYRGQEKEKMVYDNIISACLGLIQLLTPYNEALRSKLNNMFVTAIIPDRIA